MKWPTNKVWRKFASRIADGVTIAVCTGDRVSDHRIDDVDLQRGYCRCPLGAALLLRAVHVPFPTIDDWIEQFPGESDLALFFTEAFDGEKPGIDPKSENDRAARRLGLWYRKTYLGENAA